MESTLGKVSFLGLPLARVSTGDFMERIIREARSRQEPRLVGYLNAANVNLAFDSPAAARIFLSFDCLYADGQAVVWGARWVGRPVPERVNAGDFVDHFFARCAAEGLRVALVGGKPGEAQGFAGHFLKESPALQVVSIEQGYFSREDSEQVRARIESANPDIVLLGMGSPRQEELAAAWSRVGKPRVWWCVGALFEYASGHRARAPVWIRRIGLEWLFRLALEPRRLWRRYLIGNPKFVYRVLRSSPVPSASAGSASSSVPSAMISTAASSEGVASSASSSESSDPATASEGKLASSGE